MNLRISALPAPRPRDLPLPLSRPSPRPLFRNRTASNPESGTIINVERSSAPIRNATVNEKNQFVGAAYDAAGNLWGNWQYLYDAEDRMVATASVTYTYDGGGWPTHRASTPDGSGNNLEGAPFIPLRRGSGPRPFEPQARARMSGRSRS